MQLFQCTDNLVQLAAEHTVLLVQFGADTCAPCRTIQQRINRWTEQHPSVYSVYVPIETFPEIAAQESLFSVPTILVFVDGRRTICESGYFSLDKLLSQVQRYLDLLF